MGSFRGRLCAFQKARVGTGSGLKRLVWCAKPALVTGLLSEMLCCKLHRGLSVQGPPGEAIVSSGLPRI